MTEKVLVVAALAACACASSDAGTVPEPWVDVGLTAGPDGLDFETLEVGGEIPLYTFGQGGTHALLAVRVSGLGHRAFIGVTITDPTNLKSVSAPPTPEPRLLLPRPEGVYDLLPILVMTGGLVPPDGSRNGLAVEVRVEAANPDGVRVSVVREAVLSAETL